jgi:hypothetical protein
MMASNGQSPEEASRQPSAGVRPPDAGRHGLKPIDQKKWLRRETVENAVHNGTNWASGDQFNLQ